MFSDFDVDVDIFVGIVVPNDGVSFDQAQYVHVIGHVCCSTDGWRILRLGLVYRSPALLGCAVIRWPTK